MGTLKKIIGLGIVGLLLVSLTVSAAWAFATDSETSSGNQVTAGTLDLKTNNLNGVTQTLDSAELKPGKSIGPAVITLKNAGSRAASNLAISLSYTESDGSPNGTNKTADETARILEITQIVYVSDLRVQPSDPRPPAAYISDLNANGYIDVEDFKNDPLSGLTGLSASASRNFTITVQMRSSAGSEFIADGINITLTFVLNQ